jgi:integrase
VSALAWYYYGSVLVVMLLAYARGFRPYDYHDFCTRRPLEHVTSARFPAKGPCVERLSDGTHRAMIRFGTKQRRRFRITTTDEVEAADRERALVELGAAIGKAKIDPELGARILEQAGQGDVARARKAVAQLAAGLKGTLDAKPAPGTIHTFAQLGEAWTSNRLAAEHPDHIRVKRSAHKDAERLVVLNKTIGTVPVRRFVLADAKRAMAALPKGLASATRRAYAQIMGRLLALAVYPLELIPASPLPRGFLPKVTRTRATGWLYPAEEQALLACSGVPLARRVLYGFLAREGLRCGEALALAWGDLDLVRGAVRLDTNKTDDPRAWALAPGVVAALELWRAHSAGGGELVFRAPNEARLAEAFRADLATAKIDRAELFERSPTRRPIRVHDLRATFVTLSLAAGRSETWVADRTGHRSSVMINAYRRAARTAAELGLGELAPLGEAVAWREVATPNAGRYGAGNQHWRKRAG